MFSVVKPKSPGSFMSGGVNIERRQRISLGDDVDRPGRSRGKCPQQLDERTLALDYDVATGLCQGYRVAGKLDGIAQTLLRMQQDSASVQRFAVPARFMKLSWRRLRAQPAAIVLAPSLRPSAVEYRRQGILEADIYISRRNQGGTVKRSFSLADPGFPQAFDTYAVTGIGNIGLEGSGVTAER